MLLSAILSAGRCIGESSTNSPSSTTKNGDEKDNKKPERKKSRYASALKNAINQIDRVDGSRNTYEDENLDILSRAEAAICLRGALNLPEPREALVARFALEEMLIADKLGQFSIGDANSKLIVENGDYSQHNRSLNAVKQLSAYGRAREAKLVESSTADRYRMNDNHRPRRKPDNENEIIERIKQTSAKTRECLSAISAGSRKESHTFAQALLSQYKERTDMQHEDGRERLHPQNLFCTVLDVARKFSDRGWYKESDLLLAELLAASEAKGDWTTANIFIVLEQVVNAEKSKKNASSLWNKLDEFSGFSHESEIGKAGSRERITYDYTFSEKLRRFAIAFYYAGEIDRANIFVTKAIKTYSSDEQKALPNEGLTSARRVIHNNDDSKLNEVDRVYLLLDAACIKAKLKDLRQSQRYVTEALGYDPLTERPYGAKLAELASVYCEEGELDEAIKVLKIARDKNIPTPSRYSRLNTSGAYLVDFWLAKVLFEKGNIAESRKVIEKAIEASRRPPSLERRTNVEQSLKKDVEYSSSVLAGNCASAEKDMAEAALHYEEAALPVRYGMLPISDQMALRKFWLKQAIDCGARDPKFSKDVLARFYVELADDMGISPPDSRLEIYRKAVELMSDSNPQKSNLTSKMAQIVMQSKYALTNPSSKQHTPLTKEEQQKVKDAIREKSLVGIDLCRKSAKLAEANGEPTAYSKYIALANAEAGIDQLDQAMKDCMHGLSLYSGIRSTAGVPYYGWHPTFFSASNGLVAKLRSNGRTRDSVKLLEFAVSRTRAANGPASEETFDQLFELLQFYRGQKDTAQALTVLNKALQCKMQLTPIRDPFESPHGRKANPMEKIWSWARDSAKDDPKLAIEILERTIEAQRTQLPSDDMQIALTHNAFGDVFRKIGNNQRALESYQKAFEISKLYNGELNALSCMPFDFIPTLRAVGNVEEAERLQSLRAERKNGFRYQRHQEGQQQDLASIKDAYEKAKAAAPYSLDTVRLLDRLGSAADAKNDWKLYEECILEQIKVAERFKSRDLKRYKEELFGLYIRSNDFAKAETFLASFLATFDGDDRERARLQQDLINAYIGDRLLDGASQYILKLWTDPHVDSLMLAKSEVDLIDAYNLAEKQRKLDLRDKEREQSKIDEINKHLNDFSTKGKEEVRHLFAHHTQWIPKVHVYSLATRIGRLAIDSGETKHLADLLRKGESLMFGDQLFGLKEFAELWSAIGEKSHAEELRARFNAFTKTKVAQGFREFSSEPDGHGQSRIQTGVGYGFPPTKQSKDYCFSFVALASNSLTFADNSRVCMDVPPFSFSFAGTYGKLKAAQPANHSGNLSFVVSTPAPGTHGRFLGPMPVPFPFAPASPPTLAPGHMPSLSGQKLPVSGGLGPGLPPFGSGGFFPGEMVVSGGGFESNPILKPPPVTQSLPFKAPLRADDVKSQFGGEGDDEAKLGLGAGDWKVQSHQKLKALTIIDRSRANAVGRLRMFLPNKKNGETTPVFHAVPGALINANVPSAPPLRGALLELWYEGSGTIKLDRDSTFNGIIYAPHARVEIGPGDATFTGAIVARDIEVTGNSRLYWDSSLANWKPED